MSESNADACCPECGAQESHWNGSRADPDGLRAEVERLRAALETIAEHSDTDSYVPHNVAGLQALARHALGQHAREDGK